MEHGTSRSFVVTHPDDIGKVKRVEFYWEYDMDVLQPRSICFFWCNDHLYVGSIGVTEANEDGNRGYLFVYQFVVLVVFLFFMSPSPVFYHPRVCFFGQIEPKTGIF